MGASNGYTGKVSQKQVLNREWDMSYRGEGFSLVSQSTEAVNRKTLDGRLRSAAKEVVEQFAGCAVNRGRVERVGPGRPNGRGEREYVALE